MSSGLNSLKSKVAKLNVKCVPVPIDLSKQSNVVNKWSCWWKDAYNTKIKNIEDKILDFTNLNAKTTPNAKINEVKGKKT